jgi:hydrogenase expression/formation protein HypD
MKFIDEYRDPAKAAALAKLIAGEAARPMTIMEVCGTHTMSIARFGIRSLLPDAVRLISGPGCPVCVTPNSFIDHAVALSRMDSTIICTFGDMMRVPGSSTSLEREKAQGADVRIVYSTLGALELAKSMPDRNVVFLGVGFETTAPTIAASIIEAEKDGISNYSVLSANKVVPPALSALMNGNNRIDGFLLPGHVSAIIGSDAYRAVFERHPVACAVAGFEPLDILEAIHELVRQVASGDPRIHNSYRRAVDAGGNPKARQAMSEVFKACDAVWRGIGTIPASGLAIRERYSRHDASKRFSADIEPTVEPAGCRCGEILCGTIAPPECALFGKGCTPSHPVGSCMVSGEGTCAAHYKYGARR